MVSSTQQKVDQESFNRGWEMVFGGKTSKVVESSGHATRVGNTAEELQAKYSRLHEAYKASECDVKKLQAKLDRIKARIIKIKDSDTALAKTLQVQNLLAMFDDDTGKLK